MGEKNCSHQKEYMLILGVSFWARDFTILTQSRVENPVTTELTTTEQSHRRVWRRKRINIYLLLYIWKIKIHFQMTKHFYRDIFAFTLQLGRDFLKLNNGPVELGDEISAALEWDLCSFWLQVLSAIFPSLQSLNFGLIKRFVVFYMLLAVGLQPEAFLHPLICYLNTKLLFLCCKEMS